MLKSLKYPFCTIDIYSNYVISRINEGFHLTPDKNRVLEEIVNDYFKDKPFVYITHRINSYSVDPSIYLQTSKVKNLAGMAVVAEAPLSKGNAEVEKLFLKKPFEIFTDLNDAIEWVKSLIPDE
ncbi:hypothetical protein MWU58_11115 [Flavobacteriaceae bacterium S0825]|uniref:hypothetical protein n=1 Tax=Gaetbulibacter sp. S0825 TaxID=2720084 RepID=UPI0014311F6D|nr:hypothetical protein [Gaetbulibacter sp. S0825]MCK0109845.1 hypothetical protein [Flavobacteriaceae bacterium S0825]NIX65474.1 hypothetical protein [Gaetbulibacter sp. S0825]